MQSLKNIVINGAMSLALLFGLMPAALAAGDGSDFEEVKARAEKGIASSQSILGIYYREGLGVRQDYSKAFYWDKKAAEQGNKYAQFDMGYAYSKGEGVRQDHRKALEWFKKSANQNHEPAQFYIGTLYEYGDGVRQNRTTAKEWYGKSCDSGLQEGCDFYKRLNEQGY